MGSHWQVVESFVFKTEKQAERPRRSHILEGLNVLDPKLRSLH